MFPSSGAVSGTVSGAVGGAFAVVSAGASTGTSASTSVSAAATAAQTIRMNIFATKNRSQRIFQRRISSFRATVAVPNAVYSPSLPLFPADASLVHRRHLNCHAPKVTVYNSVPSSPLSPSSLSEHPFSLSSSLRFASSNVPAVNSDNDEGECLPTSPIDFSTSAVISGDEYQILTINLFPGQTVRCESGSMLYMTAGVSMETISGGGGMGEGFKRLLTGGNFFLTDLRYDGPDGTGGAVALSPSFPGSILRLDLSEYGDVVCQRGAYLASSAHGSQAVSVEMEVVKKMSAGFFGGEGFVLQRLVGNGTVFLVSSGILIRRNLGMGETLKISSGCLVGFTASVSYDISMMKGIKNVVFGGEGLFVTTLTGPGTVWIQSNPVERMVAEIGRRVPGGGGWGMPIILGGGGDSTADADEMAGGMDAAGEEEVLSEQEGGGENIVNPESSEALFGDALGNDLPSATASSAESGSTEESFSNNNESVVKDTDNTIFSSEDPAAAGDQFSFYEEENNNIEDQEDFGNDETSFSSESSGGQVEGEDDGSSIFDLFKSIFFDDDD
mmetsp:Transcript_11409/g.25035  ORF Transcript_11409/g.25035 Transcript_11409/m.25035 type:complete len:557 (-) Transcript_11409:127-1797(-)|eukprot:CAMPEP_0113309934 /NCGR_PEP_ID=MMETSP0010_2-20120614/7774_1 /TAXON_ID=216773 ORGANISM="Corethron hystrix, Strain 308" /NCGR_SAMPLE_ID=MMETSP0010_2 /ASSEMBLY_ACC=CAM_ASM_000155 /LENGTH=556 /DNA_ID=CAMNT_0000165275 /DNA_START=73 /DNA_END=1743 /DNA_ORIENTATION=+ /assembly_acc=CAM_ASM_000155